MRLARLSIAALVLVAACGNRNLPVTPCGSAVPIWSPAGGVTVSVRDPQPTADTQVHAGGLVTLTPHATDPNTCGSIPVTLAYRWSLIARPPGRRGPQPH